MYIYSHSKTVPLVWISSIQMCLFPTIFTRRVVCRAISLGLVGAALALVCEDYYLTYCTYLSARLSTQPSTRIRLSDFHVESNQDQISLSTTFDW